MLKATVYVCTVTGGGDAASRWEGSWSEWGWFAGGGGGSVNGSRYRVMERTSTYHAAQQHCLQLGGYLARIDTIREQVYVEEFLRRVLHHLIALDGQFAPAYAVCPSIAAIMIHRNAGSCSVSDEEVVCFGWSLGKVPGGAPMSPVFVLVYRGFTVLPVALMQMFS